MKFEKGKSGNPAGRPKQIKSMSNAYKTLVDATEFEIKYKLNGKPNVINYKSESPVKMAIAAKTIELFLAQGSIPALKEILDRVEGKPLQQVKIEEDNDSKVPPVTVSKEAAKLFIDSFKANF